MKTSPHLDFDIVIYGSQGSGKTTQAQILAEHFDARFFGAGISMRKAAQQDPALQAILDGGDFLPDSHFEAMVTKFVDKTEGDAKIVFEGVARNPAQEKFFAKMMTERGRPFKIIFIKVSESEACRRLELRKQNQEQERNDEERAALERRIQNFKNLTLPAIADWSADGFTVLEIDGDTDKEGVTARILAALDKQ